MTITMYDNVPLTEREVRIARWAYLDACRICLAESPQWEWQARQAAESRYPLPTLTRPRIAYVQHVDGCESYSAFRISPETGALQSWDVGHAGLVPTQWVDRPTVPFDLIDIIAKLRDNPTVQVDA